MKNILLLFFLSFSFFAQSQIAIKGQVLNKQTAAPIIGATVLEKGTTNGTITDLEGKYALTVKDRDAVLVFSFIGLNTSEKPVGELVIIDVSLEENSQLLNQTVVTALGQERDEKKLGYAFETLESTELAEVKSPNFIDNLAGKVAGVTINQGPTGVGSTSKITIRGEASFTNNNPLFVVDGTPINNNSINNFTNDAAAGFQEVDFGNGAMEVNADDIESISVLKGPSAAALYGTRASNGVILITTKSGNNAKGLGISINSSTFFDTPFKLPKFQNKYGQGNSGQFEFVDGLGGGINDNITYSWGPALDQGILIAQFDSPVYMSDGSVVRGGDIAVHGGAPITPTEFKSYKNNLRDFYNIGITSTNNISVANGFDKGAVRLSYTDLRSQSFIPGVNLDRKNLSTKLDFNPTDKLKINASVNYVNSSSDNRPSNGYGSENINYSLVAWGPRSLNIAALEDYWQPGLEGIEQYSFNYTFFDNPYFILYENTNSFNRDRVFGNLSASYQFTDELKFMVRSGVDYSYELRKFKRSYSTNRFQNGAYAEHVVGFRENNTDFLLNYSKIVGDITLDLSAGGNRMDQQALNTQTQALTLAQPGIFNLSNAASPLEVFQMNARKRINSVYGVAKLGYKNYLYVDVTGRNDWSSALASPTSAKNTSFFYPSVATSYILSNTVELPKVISFAKLRANWAQVGNDTDPYQTSAAFVAQTAYNSQPTFSASDLLANSDLLPERTTSYEVGADVRFFNNKLRFDATYYQAVTRNQIIALPVAISSGASQQIVNGGVVNTSGLEILLDAQAYKNNNFQWNVGLNFSHNVSIVKELPEGIDKLTLAYSGVYDNVNQRVWFQVEEGGRIGDMYGTGYLKNENGDFVIGTDGKYIVDNTLKKLGNYNPDFILGINNSFSYKNWDMSFLFDWRQGGVLVSRTLALAAVGGQLIETEDRPDAGIVAEGVVNTGTDANPVWVENTTAISAETYYRQYYDRNHEENNTYNASYLKLRQFSIGYTFRGNNDSKLFKDGRTLRVSIIGRNLFAFSYIPHFDPEQIAVQGQNFVNGVEDMSYPTARSIGFKIGYDF